MSPYAGEIAAYLDWYRAMGVADFAGDTVTDWFAGAARGEPAVAGRHSAPNPVRAAVPARTVQPAASAAQRTVEARPPLRPSSPAVARPSPTPAARATPVPPGRGPTSIAPDDAIVAARSQAKSARTLNELRSLLERFDGCGLRATAKNLCFYRGQATARLMLIGEAPGRDEDIAGKPFVGPAGQLLDRMLAAIGLDESAVHITNVVYWRPPGNRTPTPQETQVCAPFLVRQIELVAPEFIVLLGGAAAKQVLAVDDGIMRLRGKWRSIDIGGRSIPVLPTLHPAFLLRTPAQKRLAWHDLLAVDARLKG